MEDAKAVAGRMQSIPIGSNPVIPKILAILDQGIPAIPKIPVIPDPLTPLPSVVQTEDGSPTLYVAALDEHYHSIHGARQESAHVFIRQGLGPLLAAGRGSQQGGNLNILEIGLGTGLNAILTLEACRQAAAYATYTALETVPLPPDVTEALAYAYFPPEDSRPRSAWQKAHSEPLTGQELPWLGEALRDLHAAPWNQEVELGLEFYLTKLLAPLETAVLVPPDSWPLPPPGTAALVRGRYHLIYFDAFAPQKQPELWTEAIFRLLFDATAPDGVLVTYCAQGQFRRDLRAAGWTVEKLPGPPGKREMTRAVK